MPALREESKFRITGYKGKFQATLDAKNRLTLPAALRRTHAPTKSKSKRAKDRFVLTIGFDGGLALHPVSEWMKIEEKLSEGSYTDPDFRYFRRILYESAAEVVLDSQGRIPISKTHQEIAKIKRDVLVIGQGKFIEIWNPDLYGYYISRFKKSWEEAGRRFDLGL